MARAVLHGYGVSSGIAMGKALFVNRKPVAVPHEPIAPTAVDAEVDRFLLALESVSAEFTQAKAQVPPELSGQGELLDSHLLICKDPKLSKDTVRRIRDQLMCAEWALEETVSAIAEAFSRINSPYIRERIQDVRLVAGRVHAYLTGTEMRQAWAINSEAVFLAHDLSPADAMGLPLNRLLGLVTEQGSRTAHTGILARNLRIPAVVGVQNLEEEARDGEFIIVDALRGQILIDPTEPEIAEYADREVLFSDYEKRIRSTAAYPAETGDGLRVQILANVESSDEIPDIVAAGGEGIGLVRTEFGVLAHGTMPQEESLYTEYSRILTSMAPAKVVFRTLDLGADKSFAGRKALDEANPALGLRAIRYCFRHQDIFRRQLRAILRASVHGQAAIMFPMISGVSELRLAKSILNEARQELDAAGIPFDVDIPVGIMVELPSAVFTADALAAESDFFSIGTNDLIQYFLGVDRGNRHVAHLQQPLHPAILRAIKAVTDAGHMAGIPVSICGEMGSDPYCLPILLGMPVDEISVAPPAIAAVKHLVRRSDAEECRELLERALHATTARIVNNMVRHTVYDRFAEDISFFTARPEMDA